MSNDMGLRVDDEQATTEEARMARVMANQPIQRVTRTEVDATPEMLAIPFGKIIEEKDVFDRLNELRKMPNYYSAKLKETGKWKEGDPTIQLTPGGERRWHEGKPAFEDAIEYLAKAKPSVPLTLSAELSKSADDLIKHIGPKGLNTDLLADKTDPPTRFARYGKFSGSIIELLVFASQDAQDCIIKACVGDADPDRSDRKTLLDPIYKVAGIACGPHKEMGTVISIILCEGFTAGTSAAKTCDGKPCGGEGVDFNTNKPVVDFKESEPGVYTLTIQGAGNAPPEVSVSKNEDKVVLHRFHNGSEIATANYGIPVPFELSETTATYSAGTIVVTIKPVAEVSSSVDTAGVVKLDASGTGERIGIAPAQSDGAVAVTLTPGKYETEVTVILKQGEAGRTTLELKQAFAMPEDGDMVKCTATSSFRLPFTATIESTEIADNKITVKAAEVKADPASADAPKKEKGPATGDIPITVV